MLKVDDTALMLIDYQEKLAQVMHERESLQQKMVQLVKGMQLLQIPIVWLEQYPKGLGRTVQNVKHLLDSKQEAVSKMEFSVCDSSNVQAKLDELGKDTYLIAGIEAHICVYQTVQQLIEQGKHVEYIQDAISSRTAENKQIAMQKMNLLGAYPSSVEMALFELIKTAEHMKFKDISQLIK